MNQVVSAFLRQVWLVLLLAIVLSGSLALVDASLQPLIDANQQDRLQRAVFEVVAEGRSSQEEERAGQLVYRVLGEQQQLVGWAVPTETMGFADKIHMIIGLSADGSTITGLSILESRETPGLGDEIKREDWREKFAGQPTDATLEVVKPGQTAEHPIDAITGATISSKAVTQAINQQLAQVREALANLPSEP